MVNNIASATSLTAQGLRNVGVHTVMVRLKRVIFLLVFLLALACSAGIAYLYFQVYLDLPIVREINRDPPQNNSVDLGLIIVPVVENDTVSRYFAFDIRVVLNSPLEKQRFEADFVKIQDAFFVELFDHAALSASTRAVLSIYDLRSSLEARLTQILGGNPGSVLIRGVYERNFDS